MHQAKVLSRYTFLDQCPSFMNYIAKVIDLSHISGDLLFVDDFATSPSIFSPLSYEWLLYFVLLISPSPKGIRAELRSE